MSTNPFAVDLGFAISAERAVRIETVSGKIYECRGVKEVNEAENWVTLWNPQTFGDATTTERLVLSLISSVSVLDVEYPNPENAT
jgi:hypothetical protein